MILVLNKRYSLGTLTVDDSKLPITAHLTTSTENKDGLFVYAQAEEYESDYYLFLQSEREPIAYIENVIKPHVYMKQIMHPVGEQNLKVGNSNSYLIDFSAFDKNGEAFIKPDGYPDPKYPLGLVVVKDSITGNEINKDSNWFKIELRPFENGSTYNLLCTAKAAGKTVDVYVGCVGYEEDDYYIYHHMDNPTQFVRLTSIKA